MAEISGSKLLMPMLVLNMGGEMMNVLHQRLQAQNIEEKKAALVLHDVIRTMYSPKVNHQLFEKLI